MNVAGVSILILCTECLLCLFLSQALGSCLLDILQTAHHPVTLFILTKHKVHHYVSIFSITIAFHIGMMQLYSSYLEIDYLHTSLNISVWIIIFVL